MVFESLKKTLGLGNGGNSGSFSGKGHVLGSAAPPSNDSKRGALTPPPASTSSAKLSAPVAKAPSASSTGTGTSSSLPSNSRSASAPVAGLTQQPSVHTPTAVTTKQPPPPQQQPQQQVPSSSTPPPPPPPPSSSAGIANPAVAPTSSSAAAQPAVTAVTASKSNHSGSGAQYVNETTDNYHVFEVIFHEDRLGMSINEYKDVLPIDKNTSSSSSKRSHLISRPIVSNVKPDSEAADQGIRVSDVIISINRHQLTNFEHFYRHLVELGRPIHVQFYRPLHGSPMSSIPIASGGITSALRPFGFMPTKQPPLSAEEERAKRDAIRAAAIERSQAWDRKLSKSSSARNIKNDATKVGGDPNEPHQQQEPIPTEETLLSIRKVKEGEAKLEQQLGYSPFRPHMSFTGNSVNSISTNPGPNAAPTIVTSGPCGNPSPTITSPSPSRGVASMYRISPSTTMASSPTPRTQRPSPQTLPQGLHPQPLAQPSNFRPLASAPLTSTAPVNPPSINSSASNDCTSPPPASAVVSPTTLAMTTPHPESTVKPDTTLKSSTIDEEYELAQMTADVDDAFAMLISLSVSNQFEDHDRVEVAVQTIQKMLLNLFNHKDDLKYRSIRLSNMTFHTKVGQVSGGIELLLAAGYKYDSSPVEGLPLMTSRSVDNLMMTTSEKTINRVPLSRSTSSTLDTNMTSNPHGDEYLVHSMDMIAERRLGYTISRLSELATALQSFKV